jgi:hypothetical protein
MLGRRNGDAGRGGRVAVAAGHVGDAAPGEVAIDDVVVDDQRRVEELEGGADAGAGHRVSTAEALVGRDHHARAEPLAADGVALEHAPQIDVPVAEALGAAFGGGEEVGQDAVDQFCRVRPSRVGRDSAPHPCITGSRLCEQVITVHSGRLPRYDTRISGSSSAR